MRRRIRSLNGIVVGQFALNPPRRRARLPRRHATTRPLEENRAVALTAKAQSPGGVMEECYRYHPETARTPQRPPVLTDTACGRVPRREPATGADHRRQTHG